MDVVGSDEIDSPELHTTPNLRFFNFLSEQGSKIGFAKRLSKLLAYYGKLIRYAAHSEPRVLHILWNNKFETFDRTLLMLYYKMCGKRISPHSAQRESGATRRERLAAQSRHTQNTVQALRSYFRPYAKDERRALPGFQRGRRCGLCYPVSDEQCLSRYELTRAEAKYRLGLENDERAILFFGRIRPYKGIENLLAAFKVLSATRTINYRLILAGEPKKGSEEYLHEIQEFVEQHFRSGQVISRIQFIPDEEMELYFKAADVLVLPYKEIFQSGVLFLAYSFGLPVIATDVGSFREDIVEGYTGFLCRPGDPTDMAKAIETYFASDLFKNLNVRRQDLKDYVNANHSWHAVAEVTCEAYAQILRRKPS